MSLVIADAADPAALHAMAERTQVVITTVGPYQLYGTPLVEACVATGTGYVDLCGEPGWMRDMIDAHEAAARASGARIVFSCGFDSIPFDLRRRTAAEAMQRNLGHAGATYQRPRSRDARHLFRRHCREPEGDPRRGSKTSEPC